jgi:hypothetical protein
VLAPAEKMPKAECIVKEPAYKKRRSPAQIFKMPAIASALKEDISVLAR